MQSVFNVLFICTLFICLSYKSVNAGTLWPGLFAQSVLRTPPVFWPTPYHSSPADELATANLQQSESSGHLLGSAEHMISSDEPIPSGLFIPVDQLHRELFNSPHLLRKYSSNHYPSYHQFGLNPHFAAHPNKKLIASSKHHKAYHPSTKFKSLSKTFLNRKKPHKTEFDAKFGYLDDDFYAKHTDMFNFNKLSGHLLGEYADYNSDLDLTNKNWQHRLRPNSGDQDQTNSLINTTEEHLEDEDDLFTIKNNSNQPMMKSKQQQQQPSHPPNNGRIDLRKSNKRKLFTDHLKDMKDLRDLKEYRDTKTVKDFRDLRELNEMNDLRDDANQPKEPKESIELKEPKEPTDTKDPKLTNEKRYIENYDNRSGQSDATGTPSNDNREKYVENRNIERYNLEKFFNNPKFNNPKLSQELIRSDGRILINNLNGAKANSPTANRKEKSFFNNFKHPNGELSVISETIYQNHQIKNGKSIFF